MPLPEKFYPWQSDAATELLDQLPEATTVAVDFGHGKVGRLVRVANGERDGRPWRAKSSGRHVTTQFVAGFPWRIIPERAKP